MLAVICTAVILAGVVSLWLYRLLPEGGLAVEFAVVGFANAAFLLAWSAVHEDIVWQWNGLASLVSVSSLVDAAEVLLIVWLLRVMPPVRFAARYLLIPLITVAEGLVVLRPELTVRMILGTVLLAAGASVLLFFDAQDDEAPLSLR